MYPECREQGIELPYLMALHGEDVVGRAYLPEMRGLGDITNQNKLVQSQNGIMPLTRFVESSWTLKAKNLVSDLAVSRVFTSTQFTQGMCI